MHDLTKTAMLGTAKTATVALDAGSSIGGAWDGLALERERELLLRAGAEATMRMAGHTTQPGSALPPPAEPEDWPVCNQRIANLARTLLQNKKRGLAIELCTLLAQRERRLPPTLLPMVLDQDDAMVRQAARPLLGKRGIWLSQFNPDWRWLLVVADNAPFPANAEQIWEEGLPAERVGILTLCRGVDPERARTWLDGVWKKERAEFRSNALATFRVNLSLDDEPMLERALDDRAEAVRDRAAELLALLPGSAYVARMRERGDAMLSYTPPASGNRLQTLVRAITNQAHGTIDVLLPSANDETWKRDGIGSANLLEIQSRRWVMSAVISKIPPSHWIERWNTTPADLVAAVEANADNYERLLNALTNTVVAHGDRAWIDPLWASWTSRKADKTFREYERHQHLSGLLGLLADDERKRFVEERFNRIDDDLTALSIMVETLPVPWNEAFATKVLDLAFKRVSAKPDDYGLSSVLNDAAIGIPPTMLNRTIDTFQQLADRTKSWLLTHVLETLETRQRIYKEID